MTATPELMTAPDPPIEAAPLEAPSVARGTDAPASRPGTRLTALWHRVSRPSAAQVDVAGPRSPVEPILCWPAVARVPGAARRLHRSLHPR